MVGYLAREVGWVGSLITFFSFPSIPITVEGREGMSVGIGMG